MTRTVSLDGDWDLWYFPEGEREIAGPSALPGSGAPRVAARVPGNVELDLERAGILADPFRGENIFALRRYETYQWWYVRRFAAPGDIGDRRVLLTFRGLDCFGTVWLNGEIVGEADNMLVPHSFDLTGKIRGENEVAVRIRSAVLAARAFDYPGSAYAMITNQEQLFVRKAPHVYGWDIAPRAVSAGLWRSVELAVIDRASIRDLYYHTREIDHRGQEGGDRSPLLEGAGAATRTALIGVQWQVETDDADLAGYTLRFSGACARSSFSREVPVNFTAGNEEIRVPDARLWWPRGYGDPALYEVTAELRRNGVLLDRRTERIGIRTIELRRTGITTATEPGEFLFVCNEVPIMCKGTNWVPLDAFHSRDAERYPQALALLSDIGCNMVRCWGGNVYEDAAFFDHCDAAGILVWQDFAYACAMYPQDPEFLKRVRAEAVSVVRALRNHPCLALWAGDNEIDFFAVTLRRDPSLNLISRRVLPEVCAEEDPYRPYLPSSPYVSPEAYRRGALDQKLIPEQHLWGPRDYFKSRYYSESTAHFASEIGYHGCPGVSSMRKFIDAEYLWPWKDNPQWRVHAADQVPGGGPFQYRIKLMADQVRELFGEEPPTLEEFVIASQVSQAEAKKYFIELFRMGKWRRTGIIWWNLLDCWPQLNDAVVDYYFRRKLAYWYIRRAQAPIHLMMGEPEDWRCRLVVGNDTLREAAGEFSVLDADTGATLLEGRFTAPANANAALGSVPVSHSDHRLFLLLWKIGAKEQGSHYLLGKPPFSLAQYKGWLPKIAALPEPFDAAAVGR